MSLEDVSGASDEGENSDVDTGRATGRFGGRRRAPVDSDEDDAHEADDAEDIDEAQPHDEGDGSEAAEEEDDMMPEEVEDGGSDDGGEDEPAEPTEPAEPSKKPVAKNPITQMFAKAAVGGASKKGAPAAPAASAAQAKGAWGWKGPKAARKDAASSGETVPLGRAAATKPPPQTPKPTRSALSNSDSDEDRGPEITLPKNAGVPLREPADAVQEYEDRRAEAADAASRAANDQTIATPVTVHKSVKRCTFVLKNEKTNKWAVLSNDALVYAREMAAPGDLVQMTLDDLTVPSKRDRVSMQEAMFNEQATKVVGTVMISKLATDGTGSGTGPGMTNLLMLTPVMLTDADAELECIAGKADALNLGSGPNGEVERVVPVVMLDHELVKRTFSINNCPLPQAYNPNVNSSNKYKVPSQLEKQALVDANFKMLGPVEKTKRATKRAAEGPASGGAAGASSKADGKRAANGTGPAPAKPPADEAGEVDCVHVHVEPCFTRIKWTAIPSMGVAMAGIKCAPGTDVRLVPAGDGSYILVKTPAGP